MTENSFSQASYDNYFGEFRVRFGERSSFRANSGVNRSVIDGRLGVRVAGLRDDSKSQQDPTFEEDERFDPAARALLFGAATAFGSDDPPQERGEGQGHR
ncbi:MAG: hypothetical protein AAGB46_02360 [Verrucomicrobiota bacterium]